MNDNAVMLNTNTSPTIMARIPIIILTAENPDNINAIPKNTKLNPIRTDKNAVLKIGQIIKIKQSKDCLLSFYSRYNLTPWTIKATPIRIAAKSG